MPSEAEWEYACRAGTATPFHFGETITADLANYDATETYGNGPKGEYRKQTTEVGNFPANAFGLYDMHGNVWEWCTDHWHSNYEGAPVDGSAWLTAGDQSRRVLRGGAWFNNPRDCRSAIRHDVTPEDRLFLTGFRVSCSAPRAL
ncbi:MAG: formylglycine-generating enzyme family protein [Phormidesmis sp.]